MRRLWLSRRETLAVQRQRSAITPNVRHPRSPGRVKALPDFESREYRMALIRRGGRDRAGNPASCGVALIPERFDIDTIELIARTEG